LLIFKQEQLKPYVETTKIPLLLEKLMGQYILNTTPCQKNTDQMFILADTIFVVFYLAPHLVKKMQLVDFCARILHNNHTNAHVVLSANIHVMLLNVFSKYQHADDKIQNEPTVITFLCQTLLSENAACVLKRRTNLFIFWSICKSDHYADASSCIVIFEYRLLIFQNIYNKHKY